MTAPTIGIAITAAFVGFIAGHYTSAPMAAERAARDAREFQALVRMIPHICGDDGCR